MIGTSGPSTSMVALSTPMPRKRSEHMFGGGDQRTFAVAEHGGKFGGDHGFGDGLNFAVAAVETGADKNKTCIDGCRSKGQAYR